MSHFLIRHSPNPFPIRHSPNHALAYGPADEVLILDDSDIIDDEDDSPFSVLDPEKAHDDAC